MGGSHVSSRYIAAGSGRAAPSSGCRPNCVVCRHLAAENQRTRENKTQKKTFLFLLLFFNDLFSLLFFAAWKIKKTPAPPPHPQTHIYILFDNNKASAIGYLKGFVLHKFSSKLARTKLIIAKV